MARWSPPWGRPPRCCGRSGRALRCSRCASSRRARVCRAARCTRSRPRWPRRVCWTSSRAAATGSARCSSDSRGRSSNAPGWSPRSRGPRRCGGRPARRCTSASWSAPGWCTCTGRPGRCARRWTTGSACGRPPGAAGAARRRCRGSRSAEVDERIARLCREEDVPGPDGPALHAELASARRDGWLVSSSFQPGRTSVAAPVVRAGGEPVGGLSVAGPSALFPPRWSGASARRSLPPPATPGRRSALVRGLVRTGAQSVFRTAPAGRAAPSRVRGLPACGRTRPRRT